MISEQLTTGIKYLELTNSFGFFQSSVEVESHWVMEFTGRQISRRKMTLAWQVLIKKEVHWVLTNRKLHSQTLLLKKTFRTHKPSRLQIIIKHMFRDIIKDSTQQVTKFLTFRPRRLVWCTSTYWTSTPSESYSQIKWYHSRAVTRSSTIWIILTTTVLTKPIKASLCSNWSC